MKNFFSTSLFLIILLLTINVFAQKEEPQLTECGVGRIEIETSQGWITVETGERILKTFERRVKADDLFKMVSDRFNFKAEQKFQCDDYKMFAAIDLLSEVKDERIFEHLLEVSKSSCPYSCDQAVGGFARLGDKRALPRLLEILHRKDSCSSAVVSVIGEIGDETAIPDLIDTISAGGANDSEARLKAIEKITGLSLNDIRKQWGLLYYDNLKQFHKAMYDWWEANKHLMKKK